MKTQTHLKHPADGLYDFSLADAQRLAACYAHRVAWEERHGDKRVLITFAEMLTQEKSALTSAVAWCIEEMWIAGRITGEEYDQADMARICASTQAGKVQALMDCLLARAKREGRA